MITSCIVSTAWRDGVVDFLDNCPYAANPDQGDAEGDGHGDINCDGVDTSADIIGLVNYVFKSGISPCSHSAG